jgi:hypothetical protein
MAQAARAGEREQSRLTRFPKFWSILHHRGSRAHGQEVFKGSLFRKLRKSKCSILPSDSFGKDGTFWQV